MSFYPLHTRIESGNVQPAYHGIRVLSGVSINFGICDYRVIIIFHKKLYFVVHSFLINTFFMFLF
jgi:hypothetical protein